MNRANEILTRYTYQIKSMSDEEQIEAHMKRFFREVFDLGADIQRNSTDFAIEASKRSNYFRRKSSAEKIIKNKQYNKPSNIVRAISYITHNGWIGGSLSENNAKQLRHTEMVNDLSLAISKSTLDKRMINYVD